MTKSRITTPHKEGCKHRIDWVYSYSASDAYMKLVRDIDLELECADQDCPARAVVTGADILAHLSGKPEAKP